MNPLKACLRSIGLYERVRSSFVWGLYGKALRSHGYVEREKHIRAYRKMGLQRGDLVFDIGANHGDEVDVFLGIGCRVVAVEPDSHCLGVLRRKYHRWRLSPLPVEIIGAAVDSKMGTAKFNVSDSVPGCAKNTLSDKWRDSLQTPDRFGEKVVYNRTEYVETTTLNALIERYGSPQFVKIDVEGYELNVLQGLSQRVPLLKFEVNLPVCAEDGIACIRQLERIHAGNSYEVIHEDHCIGPIDAATACQAIRDCGYSSVDVLCRM